MKPTTYNLPARTTEVIQSGRQHTTFFILAVAMFATVVFTLSVPIAFSQDPGPDPTVEGGISIGLVPCGNVGENNEGLFKSDSFDESGKDISGTLIEPCNFNHLIVLAQRLINWLVFISVFVGAALFAYAGLLYVSSAGSEDKVKKAHDLFRSVLVGFLLVLAAWLIVYTISTAVIKEQYIDILLLDSGN